ncbi:hypothetical protein M1M24_gp31 [Polaribacter phage Freya_1]|uniref:Uncharacterized protein n=1 Tax=Polaribacter phage Freya_1 TaxID=2745662 RepID=A0A8E4ZMA9_9CAUD|nr:hypothetical protein M1M24_gp31 [Polaribacter phage Freya_1]QQV90968.1 hypothetical protein Freya2_31 [Polaribacter phage Freya_2]QQV91036.1 hypothetical protein Freya3_31 [Polaribacter phage Freya_3]QQV91104.1 hypothetical protein Freya4_31 [Polaribacter phage Freya_4]QQV91179.1 hypothetical protein Freya8_38 [Polaribacter phage Freya_8]QQV91256.1 hypothetical protein Freya9_40 [Polaribacter phage Freya_9]QQV91334.1 hypothetical protein Freya10_41 [Polaribacter phage Freya_10]QYV99913.1 
MVKLIKHRIPFILLSISFISALCSYFEIYADYFNNLGDLFGYSILTNLFMLFYYSNRSFCDATRLAVISLFSLNVVNLLYLYFGVNGGMYDLILLSLIILILILLKIQKNDASNR